MMPHDEHRIGRIVELKERLGEAFPRIAIFVVLYNGEAHIAKVLRRVHPAVMDLIDEIYVIDDASPDSGFDVASRLSGTPGFDKLRVYRNEENRGYGGNQKIGYEYAISRGFDYVILLHGDGQYAPEFIPQMLEPALFDGARVVFGSRMMKKGEALRGGMPLYKYVGNRILSTSQNVLLGMSLSEFHSGYRLYATEVLARIPFQLNSDDFHFDTQIIIQCEALGVDIAEVPIPTYYGTEICHVEGIPYATKVMWATLRYRLHTLGVLPCARYRVGGERPAAELPRPMAG